MECWTLEAENCRVRIEAGGGYLQEIICEIQYLMKQSAMIDRVEFTRLLGEDFDWQYRKRK